MSKQSHTQMCCSLSFNVCCFLTHCERAAHDPPGDSLEHAQRPAGEARVAPAVVVEREGGAWVGAGRLREVHCEGNGEACPRLVQVRAGRGRRPHVRRQHGWSSNCCTHELHKAPSSVLSARLLAACSRRLHKCASRSARPTFAFPSCAPEHARTTSSATATAAALAAAVRILLLCWRSPPGCTATRRRAQDAHDSLGRACDDQSRPRVCAALCCRAGRVRARRRNVNGGRTLHNSSKRLVTHHLRKAGQSTLPSAQATPASLLPLLIIVVVVRRDVVHDDLAVGVGLQRRQPAVAVLPIVILAAAAFSGSVAWALLSLWCVPSLGALPLRCGHAT